MKACECNVRKGLELDWDWDSIGLRSNVHFSADFKYLFYTCTTMLI